MTDRQYSKKAPRQSSASKCDITIDGANYDLTNLVISGSSKSPTASAGVGGGRANNSSKPPITVRRFSRRSSAISRNSLSRKTHHYPQLGQAGFNLFSSHHQTDFDVDHQQAGGGGGGGGCDDDDDGPPPAFSWGQYEEPSFAWEGQEEEEARQRAGAGAGAGGRRGSVGRRRGSGGNNMFALQNDNNNIMRQPHDAYFFGSNNNNDRIVPPPTKPINRRMSSMSSISMSIHTMDCPGLTELNESISSFSDHYELEEAMMASNLQKEEDDCQEIEIEPGVYLPFRGSDETWDAIKAGRAIGARCFDCTIELVATNDCQYAICPQCHTVNPIDFGCAGGGGGGNNTRGSTPKQQRGGVVHFGVVMGFKKEWCGDYHHLVQKQQYS